MVPENFLSHHQISEKITKESEQVLKSFLESKNHNPKPEDIISQNKFVTFEILKRKFFSGEEKILLHFNKFSYEDFITYTPFALRIFSYMIFGITILFSAFFKSWIMAGAGFVFFMGLMILNFYKFRISVLNKAETDFCAFEHWYEKEIISFTYRGKIFRFPSNWSNVVIHERLETNRT